MNINYNPHFRTKTGTVYGFLREVKYKLDFYQREYVWNKATVLQLLKDLADSFLSNYQPGHDRKKVASYSHYFLGSIITCRRGAYAYVIDGQQRLTTLTLLLMLLRNLHKEGIVEFAANLDKLIFSSTYGEKSFNLNIEERVPFMEALYYGKEREFDLNQKSNSVKNMYYRYCDFRDNLTQELPPDDLPHFVDWLLHRVIMVEINVNPPDKTHSIFQTTNDRGQPLRPVELLKGQILANVDSERRPDAEASWVNQITAVNEVALGSESVCIKNWFWSQYAQSISSDSEDAETQDFERIDSEFHRWLRDASNASEFGLSSSEDFINFIKNEFVFFSEQYIKICKASNDKDTELQSVRHIAQLWANHRFMVLLSPLKPDDSPELVNMKMQLTAYFIEVMLVRHIWNDLSIGYSQMISSMFTIMKEIRELDLQELKKYFSEYLENHVGKFEDNSLFGLNKRNSKHVHWILARITDHIEVNSGFESRFDQYFSRSSSSYELKHVLPDYSDLNSGQTDETHMGYDFDRGVYDVKRNSIGGFILLPKSLNAKLSASPQEERLNHYKLENVLARSLHPDFYDGNSEFSKFVKRTNLPFRAFSASDTENWLKERCLLYCKIANQIWSSENFNRYLSQCDKIV